MKKIICIGIFIVLAGCATVQSGEQAAGPVAEGWSSPQKTDQLLAQDLKECKARCLTA